MISLSALVILLAVAFLLPVPYVKLSPGPTYNVIGEVNSSPVIKITGVQTYPTTGNLDMLTVMESGGPRGGLTFVDAMASWFNPADAVLPRELIYPDNISGEDVKQQQAIMFSTSESDAIAAALTYLKMPVETKVVVTAVYSDTPAFGLLEPADEIVSVNGEATSEPINVSDAVRGAPIGTPLTFAINRGGKAQTVTVTSAENPEKPGTAYVGIGVGRFYAAKFDINFTLQEVGGPSAGTMFSLGIIDKLTPGDLAKGRHIAGTGTISPDGKVGAIGGIRQKLAGARAAGAELFLIPAVHCKEAEGFIPDGLTVTPINTLAEAVSAVEKWTSGGTVPSCESGPVVDS